MKVLVKYWPKPPTKHRLEILVAPTRKRAAALLGLKRLPYPDFKLRSGWVEIGRGDRGKTRIAGIKIDGVELPDEIQFREILATIPEGLYSRKQFACQIVKQFPPLLPIAECLDWIREMEEEEDSPN